MHHRCRGWRCVYATHTGKAAAVARYSMRNKRKKKKKLFGFRCVYVHRSCNISHKQNNDSKHTHYDGAQFNLINFTWIKHHSMGREARRDEGTTEHKTFKTLHTFIYRMEDWRRCVVERKQQQQTTTTKKWRKKRAGVSWMWHGATTYTCPYTHCALSFTSTYAHRHTHTHGNVCAIR